jgi:hypothetical protein
LFAAKERKGRKDFDFSLRFATLAIPAFLPISQRGLGNSC